MKWVTSAIFSPDATQIVSTSDNTIQFWDLKTGLPKGLPLADEHTKNVFLFSFSPDGAQIAAASSHGTISLWHIASRQLVSCIEDVNGVTSITFSPDGKQLVLAYVDGPTVIWNPEDGTRQESSQLWGDESVVLLDMKQGRSSDEALLRWWPSDNADVGVWAYVDGKVIKSDGSGLLTIIDVITDVSA